MPCGRPVPGYSHEFTISRVRTSITTMPPFPVVPLSYVAKTKWPFFYRLKDRLWAVPIRTDPVLAIGPSSLAFELSGVRAFTGLPNYVVTRAGDRVLAAKTLVEATGAREIQVMVNWREQLRHRVPLR